MKNIALLKFLQISLLLFILVIISCKSDRVVLIDGQSSATSYINKISLEHTPPVQMFRRKGFRYRVPDGMTESPADAFRYKYDNLILDRGTDYFSSSIVIAIRHYELTGNQTLSSFTKMDQSSLRQQVRPVYENGWRPDSLDEKNIEYESYQFNYVMQRMRVYQRSVYLRDRDKVHIISLSSLHKNLLNNHESESFWKSVRVD